MIKAAVNYGGDVLGDNILIPGLGFSIGSLGMAIDAFIHGMYRRRAVELQQHLPRAARRRIGLGAPARDHRPRHQPGLCPLGGRWRCAHAAANRPRDSVRPVHRRRRTLPDRRPGPGHWFHGDRIGGTNKYLGTRVFVRRCRHLEIAWGATPALMEGADGRPAVEEGSTVARPGDARGDDELATRRVGIL